MRLRIQLENKRGAVVPLNYQHHLTAAVYGVLANANSEYAKFLHEVGYGAENNPKRFKFFVFSWIRGRQQVEGDTLRFLPGSLSWQVSSPVPDFLAHFATGLLAKGVLNVGSTTLAITQVQALSLPSFADPTRFSCLSPIVAALPIPNGGTHYLTPCDGKVFAVAIRSNLIRKHQILYGHPPTDDQFDLVFDSDYLDRSHGGTKLITYKDVHVRAAFAPFRASGSADLLRLGYEAGFGEKNAGGFGMVEAVAPTDTATVQ